MSLEQSSTSFQILFHLCQESCCWTVSLDVSFAEARGVRSTCKENVLPVTKHLCHRRKQDGHYIYIRWRSLSGVHIRGRGYLARNGQPSRNILFCFLVSVMTPGGLLEHKELSSGHHTLRRISNRVSNYLNPGAVRPLGGHVKLAYPKIYNVVY